MALLNAAQYDIYGKFIRDLHDCSSLFSLRNIILTYLPKLIEFDSAVLLEFDSDGMTVRSGIVQDLDPDSFNSYSSHYQHHDIYKQIVNSQPLPPAVEQSREYMDYSEWKHNQHRSEFLIPQGIYHIASLNLRQNSKVTLSFSMHRTVNHPFFDDREMEILRWLVPSIQVTYNTLRDLEDSIALSWIDDLTAREHQILPYLLSDMPNDMIAHIMGISPNTLKTHIRRILNKSQCGSRFDLVVKYQETVFPGKNHGSRKRA